LQTHPRLPLPHPHPRRLRLLFLILMRTNPTSCLSLVRTTRETVSIGLRTRQDQAYLELLPTDLDVRQP
jgi:hypothetical protein